MTLEKVTTLSELLTHLYVLIPVFDNAKHYFIGEDELEKLLAHGSGWLDAAVDEAPAKVGRVAP